MSKERIHTELANRKGSFFRNLTITYLNYLNRRIAIEQVVDDRVEQHTVPFFYNFGNDENFIKDFFIEYPHLPCHVPQHAEGNFESWPKGIITYTNYQIKSQEILNKFVRATYKKGVFNDNNEKVLNAFSAYLFAIPMVLTFDLEVHAGTLNQGFEILESTIEEFYKQNVFYFQFRGLRIPAQAQFPDIEDMEKKKEFTYQDDQSVKLTQQTEVETFFPVLDEDTERHKRERILNFKYSINAYDEMVTPEQYAQRDGDGHYDVL